jgi:hypothetical protein
VADNPWAAQAARDGRLRAVIAERPLVIAGFSMGTSAAFSGGMTSKILAVLLLSANLASAEETRPAPAPDGMQAAVASEREAATREEYYAQLTTIAERDIVTAQIIRDMALKQWDMAVRADRTDDATRWAKRHSTALRDEQEAQGRAKYFALARDQARSDFQASADEVRRLERRASR